MRDRLPGLLLFLPVPIVLVLFTQAPLGPAGSLALGVALMLTHRMYARPFSLARAERRCLWCGGAATTARPLGLREPFGETNWHACRTDHRAALVATLDWARRHGPLLRLGILGTLVVFLVAAPLAATGRLVSLRYDDAVAFFRLGIAVSVLPFGWLGPRIGPAPGEPIAVPFPVHIQALVGTWAVLWLFRLVGLVWLGLGLVHLAGRLGLL